MKKTVTLSSFLRFLLRVVLPILIVAGGFWGRNMLMKMRRQAQRGHTAVLGALVDVTTLTTTSRPLKIRVQGTVQPARQVVLSPQVQGKIIWQHAQLTEGGRFTEGEEVLHIEARDYQLATRQAKAAVRQAEGAKALERGRKAVAEREWKLIGASDTAAETRARALRDPQARSAEAVVLAAKSGLERARLNERRTKLKVPFNAVVIKESVDLGQVVGPNTQVAQLVGTDAFFVHAMVPMADLRWIRIPKTAEEAGASVTIVHDVGGDRIERTGEVVRLLTSLDPVGRMACVVVRVEDPLSLKDGAPLLLGAYVDVIIEGNRLDQVFEVPRSALREGDKVWLVDHTVTEAHRARVEPLVIAALAAQGRPAPFGRLMSEAIAHPELLPDLLQFKLKSVTVARRLKNSVLVSKGLKAGQTLITSRLSTPIPGMPIRLKVKTESKTELGR